MYNQTDNKGSGAMEKSKFTEEQSAFAAKGAENVVRDNYSKLNPEDKLYGCNLVEDGVPKPGYYNLQLPMDKLRYFQRVETIRADDVRLYRFITESGRQVFVDWSATPQDIDLSSFSDD